MGSPRALWRVICLWVYRHTALASTIPTLSLSLQPTLTMIPLHLSLVVLSCLSFAGAVPFHIPLVRKRDPIPVEDLGIAADALRNKYGYPHSSSSKRQDTAAIPLINLVCPWFSP